MSPRRPSPTPRPAAPRRWAADRRPRTAAGFSAHAAPHVAAEVERLEDRTLLTVYTVDSTDDAGVSTFTGTDGRLTLREAVEAARRNVPIGDAPAGSGGGQADTIRFDLPAGTTPRIVLQAGQLSVTDFVVIDGRTSGGVPILIDANGSRGFEVSGGATAVLQFLDVTGGANALGGGALRVREGSTVGMIGIRMFGNRTGNSGGSGGAIRVEGNSLLVAEGPNLLLANTSTGTGGAVSVSSGSTVQFLANAAGRTELLDNTADSGGAVSVSGGAFVAAGANFAGNVAAIPSQQRALGGAISNSGGGVALFDSTFSGNTADIGGAVYSDDGVLEVQRSTFTFNRAVRATNAGGFGGAIAVEGGVLVTGNSVFANNSSEGNGGAIGTNVTTVAGFGAVLLNNTARGDGGGVSTFGGSLTANGFAFGDGHNPGNFAGGRGGGLSVRNGIGLLRGGLFLGNAAGLDGGGLATRDVQGAAPRLEVIDGVFADNGAVGLGGAVSLERSLATLTRTTLSGNRAVEGGGVAVRGGQTVLVETTLNGNAAEFRGGGLFTLESAVVASLQSDYVNNGGPGDLRPTLGRLRAAGLDVPLDTELGAAGVNIAAMVADSGGGVHHAGSSLALRLGTIAGNTALSFPDLFVVAGSAFSAVGTRIG